MLPAPAPRIHGPVWLALAVHGSQQVGCALLTGNRSPERRAPLTLSKLSLPSVPNSLSPPSSRCRRRLRATYQAAPTRTTAARRQEGRQGQVCMAGDGLARTWAQQHRLGLCCVVLSRPSQQEQHTVDMHTNETSD